MAEALPSTLSSQELPEENQLATIQTTGLPTSLDENQKRWLVVGICMHMILAPLLGEYVDKIMTLMYNSMVTSDQINTQRFPVYLKSYLPSNTFLNYEAINDNHSKFGRATRHYNFKVLNAVEFSKLFLQTHMAKYTAFDESCDLSALLGIMINIDQFPSIIQIDALNIRSIIRNPWAHCNVSVWDANMYSKSFMLMKQLVIDLNLNEDENQKVIDELNKWEISGTVYLDCSSIGFEQRRDVRKKLQLLKNNARTKVALDVDANFKEVFRRLEEYYKIVHGIMSRLEKMEKQVEYHDKAIGELAHENQRCQCFDSHKIDLEKWEEQDSCFVERSAVKRIDIALECNNYVIVTGNISSGKTALVRHVALKFKKMKKYNVIPCSSLEDVFKHYKERSRQLCILEDIFGKFAIHSENVRQFTEKGSKLYYILGKGYMKLLATCRTEVYNELCLCNNHFSSILIKYNTYDLSTKYSIADNQVIASKYPNQNEFGYLKGLFQQNDSYSDNILSNCTFDKTQLLERVYDMFCKEWDSLQSQDSYKYCMLLMCVVYNGTIHWDFFEKINEINTQTKKKLQTMFRWCNISSSTRFESSLKTIQMKLDSTLNVYVRKLNTQNSTIDSNVIYSVIHSEMFNFLCRYFGEKMILPVLQFADLNVIRERCFLESLKEDCSQFTIKVSTQHENEYFSRLAIECKVVPSIIKFLKSPQMKFIDYRSKFHSNVFSKFDTQAIKDVMIMEVPDAHCNVFTFSCIHGYHLLVSTFINNGMDVNEPDGNETPLTAACANGFIDIAKMLISKGADVNKITYSGQFPLYVACNKDDDEIVQLLIDKEVKVNTIYKTLGTCLYDVCLKGQLEIAKILIDNNADINLTGECKETPVYAACANGHDKILSLLIGKGADIYKMSSKQLTPLTVALQNQHNKIVEILFKKGNLAMLLYSECEAGCFDTVKILLGKGASIYKSVQGKTTLFAACKSGNLSLVQFLLARKVNINNDTIQTSPLYAACMKEHYDIIKTLLDNGADMELVFYIMCKRGNEKCVEFLLQNGADINKVQNFGEAPLHAACTMGQLGMVKLLVNKNANINLRDTFKRTPLSLSRSISIREFLKAKGAH